MSVSLTANIENYLKAVYLLEGEGQVVRVKDIADRLGVSCPSTSGMMKKLLALGLVEHERYGYVRLSTEGRAQAARICRCGERIARFLVSVLAFSEEDARRDACRLEHAISESDSERLLACFDALAEPGPLADSLRAALRERGVL